MLQLCNIDKSYGKNHALNHFSFSFSNGIYALLGPNGAGKSTLMNILVQNLLPDSGTILLDGKDTRKMGASYRKFIGYMPQYTGMYPNFTVLEMLSYIAKLKGLEYTEAIQQIDSLLTTVELADVKDRRLSMLSGGMRQRVALVQALLADAKIILLDEPTAGLDPKQRIIVRNLISQYALHHTVLLATHVVSDVESIAQTVLFLKKGSLLCAGSVKEISAQATGKIFEVVTDETGFEELRQRYRVLHLSRSDETLSVRIIAEQKPDGAIPVKPTLEDSYLYTFDDLPSEEKETILSC